jgi:chitin disaccharide deacetylase
MRGDTLPRGCLLIVTADDFGLHEDINEGILLAHTRGIVTSTSVVACGEAFAHAAEIMKRCPNLDVGVHLTLVGERPISPAKDIKSLVGSDGWFVHSHRNFAVRLLGGSVSAAEIRCELRAQIERVLTTGRRLSHLDSHQHVHLFPLVWRVTRELAREYGIRWIRTPQFTSLFGSLKSPTDALFRLGLNTLSATITRFRHAIPKGDRIRTPGLHLSGRLGEADLMKLLGDLRPGISEIVTHPGVKTGALSARYGWNYEWSAELAALTSPRTVEFLRSSGITLTRFSEC